MTSRDRLLDRLTGLSAEQRALLQGAPVLVHASICLPRYGDDLEDLPSVTSGAWQPYLQPGELPSGWDVSTWFADVERLDPGSCAETAVLGVPDEPVPLAWCDVGKTFRMMHGGQRVGAGVVLAVHTAVTAV